MHGLLLKEPKANFGAFSMFWCVVFFLRVSFVQWHLPGVFCDVVCFCARYRLFCSRCACLFAGGVSFGVFLLFFHAPGVTTSQLHTPFDHERGHHMLGVAEW